MKAKFYLDNEKITLTRLSKDRDGDIVSIEVNYTLNWDWGYPDSEEVDDIIKGGSLISPEDAKAIVAGWARTLSDKLFSDDLG